MITLAQQLPITAWGQEQWSGLLLIGLGILAALALRRRRR